MSKGSSALLREIQRDLRTRDISPYPELQVRDRDRDPGGENDHLREQGNRFSKNEKRD